MFQKRHHIKRSMAYLLCLLILASAVFSFPVIPAHAGWEDCAIGWNSFNSPGFIADYTYKGQIIRDHESTGSGDPSHGPANVPPAETDLASGAGATNPGPYTTPFFGYYDGGTPYVPSNPSTMNDDFILFRMRIEGDPRHGNEFVSKHWNVLLDVDADGYKEYWIDLQGDYSQNSFDRLNILYDNINSQVITDPDRTNPLVRVNYFTAYNSPDTNSPCSTYGRSHTRAYAINDGTGDWYIEEQIPMTAFKDSYGNQVLYPDSPVAFVFSTGASNNDPLQKDWMMDLNYLSDADPITFGDIIIPQGTPLIEFTDSSLNFVSFYTNTATDEIYIYANDRFANTNINTKQTIQVTVTDPVTGDDEIVDLIETGNSTGIFTNAGICSNASQLCAINSDCPTGGTCNFSEHLFTSFTTGTGDNNGTLYSAANHVLYVSYTNSRSQTVTDRATIIDPCTPFMEFTRANGLPSNNFILTNDINTSDKVYLTVAHSAANTNPNTIQNITVSLSGNDAYTMTLYETGNNTGIFRNTTGLNTQIEVLPVSLTNSLWEDVDGGTVTATYNYNVGGCSGSKTTTATLFVTPAAGRVYFTNSAGTLDVNLYGPNQQVYIKLDDILPCNPTGTPRRLTVTVSSPVDSDTVTVTETAPGSGVFRNTTDPLVTATYDGSVTVNDGVLEVRNGDTITITYNDCNDGDNDSANNNKTDTASYNSPDVVINEVLFWPLNIPYSGDPDLYDPSTVLCQTEYVQIYNTSTGAVNLSAYSITDGDNFNFTLPSVSLAAGQKAYIAFSTPYALPDAPYYNFAPFQDVNGNWYILAPVSTAFPSNELGDPGSADPSDQVSLYKNGTIIDYIAWSPNTSQSTDFLGDDSAAVSAGIWQDDAFKNVNGISMGQAIKRGTTGYDSNSPEDWVITSDTLGACRAIVTRSPISGFRAYNEAGKVVAEWKTASETATVGFYLLRLDKTTNRYEQVNKALLPATLDSPQGGSYRLVDYDASPDQVSAYKLVEIEHSGRKNTYGPFPVSEGYGYDGVEELSGVSSVSFVDNNRLKPFWRISDRTSAIKAAGILNAEGKDTVSATAAKKRKGNAAKLSILQDGLYYADSAEIAKSVNTSQKDITNRIKSGSLSLSSQGNPVAYLPSEDGSGIFYYGAENDSVDSPENIYWLRKEAGLHMQQLGGNAPAAAEDGLSFTDTLHTEQNLFDVTALFTDPASDYWVWEYFVAGDSSYDKRTFTINVKNPASDNDNPSLRVQLIGGTESGHHATIKINGNEIGNILWNGTGAKTQDMSFDRAFLNEGSNSVEISAILEQGVSYSIFYLDSIDLTYKRLYRAVDNKLLCKGSGNPVVTVSGFTRQDIKVFDLTDNNKPVLLTGVTVDGAEGNYRASFVPASPEIPFLVTAPDTSLKAAKLLTDAPSNLKSAANSADYIIITTEALEKAAKTLEKQKKSMKLKTMTVFAEDIMDEFNNGISSPEAIKDFLSYAYANWKNKPEYVLLAGKGSYDYKNYQGFNKNLLPPAMVGTPDGLFPSDNYLADINNDHVPEMAIGRIPAATEAELTVAVQKIITYEKSKDAAWKTKILLAADKPGEGETFPSDSNEIAALIPLNYFQEKVYLTEGSLNASRQELINGINNGALLLNYIGHAGIDRLSQSGLLTSEDISLMNNAGKLPVLSTMTCLTALFAIPGSNCLAESLLMTNKYGAAAFWAPTGMSDNYEAKALNKEMVKALLKGGKTVLGDVILQALGNYKNSGGKAYMLDIYTLIGDPALLIIKK